MTRAWLSCIAALALTGCVSGPARSAYGVHYYWDAYPHTYYRGRTVYWIDDSWRYRDGGRWYRYTYEPPELYRYRMGVQVAPPAYAPPAYRPPPPPPAYPRPAPPPAAPPATRVR